MSGGWDALAARGRGLGAHLLSHAQWTALERVESLQQLDTLLRATPYAIDMGADTTAIALEAAVRRAGGRRLRTLARWAVDQTRCADMIFHDEDRRSLRALVRGAVASSPASERTASCIPTPALPESALGHLARAHSAAALAAELAVLGHPFAPSLLEAAQPGVPDLFELELAIERAFADHVLRSARGCGRSTMDWVRDTIDELNTRAALAVQFEPKDVRAAPQFLQGGHAVDRRAFAEAVELRDFGAAAGALADHCADTWLEPVLRKARPDGSVEASLLAARILLMRRRARIAPVSAAPVFAFALQLRAETIRLRHLIWRIQLTGPTPVAARIVTT